MAKEQPERNKLIIDGWNVGLTGGALAILYGVTRSAVMGVLGRARRKGVVMRSNDYIHNRSGKVVAAPKPRNKQKPGIPVLAVPPVLLTHRPEGNWQKRRPPPKLIELVRLIVASDALTGALWVGFMDLQDNAGCRYSLDAKLFCNAPGYPYCPEHKAIVNPPSAQRGSSAALAKKKNYGG